MSYYVTLLAAKSIVQLLQIAAKSIVQLQRKNWRRRCYVTLAKLLPAARNPSSPSTVTIIVIIVFIIGIIIVINVVIIVIIVMTISGIIKTLTVFCEQSDFNSSSILKQEKPLPDHEDGGGDVEDGGGVISCARMKFLRRNNICLCKKAFMQDVFHFMRRVGMHEWVGKVASRTSSSPPPCPPPPPLCSSPPTCSSSSHLLWSPYWCQWWCCRPSKDATFDSF